VLFKELGMNLALIGDLRIRSNLKTYDDVRVSVVFIPVLLRADSTENSHKVVVEVRVSVQRRQRIGRPTEVVPIELILWVVEDDAPVQQDDRLLVLLAQFDHRRLPNVRLRILRVLRMPWLEEAAKRSCRLRRPNLKVPLP
jgi:hypothetical protein